ncbi:MAG: hypothetical protein RBR69_03785 [Candidatus Cloacimonadaceae bacterium]|jgi:hypothetical protein|nr:hypothetical protein [Candidatus Cloacimonadota bacterium]MDY0127232.1 hypothetical protein [Candidatus Cloacimonadaceae bacterium]MCB5254507.1 hypothetical protein [Candidatus Cloacimonadota bacterium]MCK9178260.1 hypothetical protein [Candidatus Cloacimonadota bacterium]MCK9242164.1 hypothetical protein [Candidatus Cloacimonadota bacterium]
MKYLGYILLLLLLLSGCAGEDDTGKDTTPPAQPILIPHLGDTGDEPIFIDGAWVELTDENNGIDAVPEGQMMRIAWEPLVDTDLSHMKIYRFSDIDLEPVEIDEIQANQNSYLDRGPLVERTWYSYFVELFDAAGNSSVSDTVSYAILAKPYLISPDNGSFQDISELKFWWNRADDSSGFYRILVWDEDRNLIWHTDFNLATEDDPLSLPFPIITSEDPIVPGDALRWRIDYFDWDEEHQMHMGSESPERVFIVR